MFYICPKIRVWPPSRQKNAACIKLVILNYESATLYLTTNSTFDYTLFYDFS